MAQASLGLSMDQKFRIVALRRQFLGRLQGIQHSRAVAAAALRAAMPESYDDIAGLNAFTEASIAQEGHLRALIQEHQEAYGLAQYGIREVRPCPSSLYATCSRRVLHQHSLARGFHLVVAT